MRVSVILSSMLISTWFHQVWSLNHTQERTPTFMQKSPCKVICKACEGAVSHNSQNIAIKLHQIMNLIMLFKHCFQKCVNDTQSEQGRVELKYWDELDQVAKGSMSMGQWGNGIIVLRHGSRKLCLVWEHSYGFTSLTSRCVLCLEKDHYLSVSNMIIADSQRHQTKGHDVHVWNASSIWQNDSVCVALSLLWYNMLFICSYSSASAVTSLHNSS